MRIERLRVDAFGRLGGFDTGPESLGPLVVVLGPNEAGKSTLFSFLTTALYGFQPASRERNPHVPWNSDEAAGEIQLRLSDGGCATVSRRLRSSPTGRLTLGEATRELRNQPVPWVEHIPRTVFRQVFAITLSELAGLDEETWAHIQDRVLGSMGTTDLRPARAVADKLEREAAELWRPNRRGNQRLRDLQEEIRALRGRRLEALERDRSIRLLVEELEDVRHKLREMRSERERDAIVLERTQELLPVKRQLDRIAALRAEGGPPEELTGLPGDLRAELRRLAERRGRCEADRDQLEESARAPRLAVQRFDADARALQARRGRITDLVAACNAAGADADAVEESEARIRELDFQLQTASSQFLRSEAPVPTHERLESTSLDLLRDRVRRAEAARAAAKDAVGAEAAEAGREDGAAARGIGVPAALLGLGSAFVAWGALGGPEAATMLGVALMAVGITLLAARPSQRAPAHPSPERAPAPDPIEEVDREIAELLDGLPVRPEFLDPPGAPLLAAVERLQSLATQRSDAVARLDDARARIAALDAHAAALAATLGEEAPTHAPGFAATLERRLSEADRAEEAARAAEGELGRLEGSRARAEAELRDVMSFEQALRDRLHALTGPGESDPVTAVQRRLEAHARADRLDDELERAHPDLADLASRIRSAEEEGSAWTLDDADLATRRTRLEEIQGRIEELVGRAEALETEIAHLRERETVDVVDSEILGLQEEERRLATQRDRTWLVAQLLRGADRRFREEHQPDLLRRASGYLSRLTGGRYDRILVDELGDGELFQLVGPGLPRPVPLAGPISTGTLEQAYLSLRLAIVDHLDRGSEPLPLFIDEALVNWDQQRRRRGLDVLSELSGSRQVFAFTCHPDLAHQLEAHGARVLELER